MYEKQGYLKDKYKIFHIKDRTQKDFSFHYHDFYKIVVFLEGNVTYSVEGKNYVLIPKDIVLVGRNEIHKPIVDPSCDYERIVVYLSQSFFSEFPELSECFEIAKRKHNNVLRVSASDFSKLTELFLISKSAAETEGFGNRLVSKIRLEEALLVISKSVVNNGFLYNGKISYDTKMIKITDYINEHLCEELSVEALSNRFFVSKYYFMHIFKEYTGITVHRYILEKRILLTKELCEKGEQVTKACLQAGFKDYTTYLRAKKRFISRLNEEYESL